MSPNLSRKLFAKRWRKECGYTTAGSIPYLAASFFSCPDTPLVVILSPRLLRNTNPLASPLPSSHEAASARSASGMYILLIFPPLEYRSM